MENRSKSIDKILIPLNRRIAELMEHKGKVYTQEFVAKKIGIHRDTFRTVLKGDRPLMGVELRKLSETLKLSVQRINQTDIVKLVTEIRDLLARSKGMERAFELAEKYLSVAVGVTEQCDALNLLGNVYFEMKNYEKSHDCWVQAYEKAVKIHEKYGETKRLHVVLRNLMTSFTVRKEYSNSLQIIRQVEPIFKDNPKRMSAIAYSHAMIAYDTGNMDEAREYLGQSLDWIRKTDDQLEIGNAENNLAYMEYLLGHYETAKELYSQAKQTLKEFTDFRLIALKDYVKTLLHLGLSEQAIEQMNSILDEIDPVASNGMYHKFLLLRAIAARNASDAEAVLENARHDDLKILANKFLMEYYADKDDSEKLLKYYKIAGELVTNHSAIYDGKGL